MDEPGAPPPVEPIGYLAVVDVPRSGFCGGFLLVNAAGRPLEFHCTLPVVADRAQEILYGASLESYVFADLIGRTLIERPSARPALVLVEQEALLAVQAWTITPVIRIWHEARANDPVSGENTAIPREPELRWQGRGPHSGEAERVVPGAAEASLGSLVARIQRVLDPLEPFERIRQAIHEAHSVRAA
jgi:hypothetical protein